MNNQQSMAMGSGLTRYRSAPSSYFASLLDSPSGGFGSDDFERLFNPRASSPETQIIFSRFMNSTGQAEAEPPQFLAPTKIEPSDSHTDADYSDKGTNDSPLIRHSSSPAGLFAIDEFGTVRALGDIGDGNIGKAEAEPSSSSFCSNRSRSFKSQMMDPITEMDTTNDFPITSWDDNDFLKAHQKYEGANRPPTRLSHHLSLPKSFGELSPMEKLLQDSVPCKIRAKRGCATHPRSIAERVRRTKISERMRKLQELVPNMEKQTNTSDMLDLAVEYIKDLQGQLKTLSDDRQKCSCEAKLGS